VYLYHIDPSYVCILAGTGEELAGEGFKRRAIDDEDDTPHPATLLHAIPLSSTPILTCTPTIDHQRSIHFHAQIWDVPLATSLRSSSRFIPSDRCFVLQAAALCLASARVTRGGDVSCVVVSYAAQRRKSSDVGRRWMDSIMQLYNAYTGDIVARRLGMTLEGVVTGEVVGEVLGVTGVTLPDRGIPPSEVYDPCQLPFDAV
jgi:hypothetical protein